MLKSETGCVRYARGGEGGRLICNLLAAKWNALRLSLGQFAAEEGAMEIGMQYQASTPQRAPEYLP
jgi:hypothetical protein